MKIGIIGCNGFLAKAIIRNFSSPQNQFLLFGRSYPTINILSENKFFSIDLLESKIPSDLLLSCNLIFYTAAVGVQSKNTYTAEQVFKINTFLPIEIKQKLVAEGFEGSFVSFGTYFEIGSSMEKKAFSEIDILQSIYKLPNEYCISKRLLTHYFFWETANPINSFHFILPTIYGSGEDGNRLIPYTINCLKNKIPPSFSSGEQVRQYLHVDDAVTYLMYILKINPEQKVINIPGPDTLSIKDLIHYICMEFKEPFREEWFGKTTRADLQMPYLALKSEISSILPNTFKAKCLKTYLSELNYS